MFVQKFLVAYIFVQVAVTVNHSITVLAENTLDSFEETNESPESDETPNYNIENDDGGAVLEYDSNEEENDNNDNSDFDITNEPFDPEKNGFLLHEYYDQVYQKHPDYDASMMKQNLNYLGDILSSATAKEEPGNEVDTVGDQFELDPKEKELFMKDDDAEKGGDNPTENEEKTADVANADMEAEAVENDANNWLGF